MLLDVNNVTKSYGERTLFDSVSFRIESGEKIGLIGANGCGKTTLFRLICGEESCDKGGIVRHGGATVGVLSQHACLNSDKTAYDEALTIFDELAQIENELEKISKTLEKITDDQLILRQHELTDKFTSDGGLTYKARTRSALMGLGFSEEELSLPVSMLSGGQRSKVELCKLLLSSPDVMLLDEPTNHLDIQSIEWLDGYIKASNSAVVVISHDRFFLDRVVTKILELDHCRLTAYPGNYSKYLMLKEQHELTVEREYSNKMKEIHRIEGIIKQQKQWNRERNIKTAESKQKSIDRIKADLVEPDKLNETVRMGFSAADDCGNEVLHIEGLTKAYGEKTLYKDVTFDLLKGQRTFIIGPNGCGKTTLMRDIKQSVGGVSYGSGVRAGYFDQHQRNLNLNGNIFDEIRNSFSYLSDTEIRCALASFLFKGEQVFAPIEELSGGERARVALCKLMLSHDNLLLLDEPTNHLDLHSREVLEEALADYDGTIIAISHDRYFINRLATDILYFDGDSIKHIKGNYDDYAAIMQANAESNAAQPVKVKSEPGGGGKDYKLKKQAQSNLRKAKTAVAKSEQEVARLESEIEAVNERLSGDEATDFEAVTELTKQLDDLQNRLEAEMNNWEQASMQLAEAEAILGGDA